MDIRDALKNNYQTSQMVCGAYLGDLTDEESMKRPHAVSYTHLTLPTKA